VRFHIINLPDIKGILANIKLLRDDDAYFQRKIAVFLSLSKFLLRQTIEFIDGRWCPESESPQLKQWPFLFSFQPESSFCFRVWVEQWFSNLIELSLCDEAISEG